MTEFICPMHPDIHKTEAGSCPKCGMALEPETISAPITHSQFTCPMHPQIVRDQPGNCPICGMTLEPMTVTVGIAAFGKTHCAGLVHPGK